MLQNMAKATLWSIIFLEDAVVFKRVMKVGASYENQKFITIADTRQCPQPEESDEFPHSVFL
jgi:hypothetical protein